MPEDAIDQLHGEVAFFGGEAVLLYYLIKKLLDRGASLIEAAENFSCSQTGSFR